MRVKLLLGTCMLFLCIAVVCISNAKAVTLYAVSGDGSDIPETLFELNQVDASSSLILGLGNGNDGEAIGFNPNDGLIYHASGHEGPDVIFEKINSTFTGVTGIDITGTDLEDEEAQALTWDATRGEFLWKQDHDYDAPLFSVTTAGVETLIGDMDHQAKGLAFVGTTLYSVSSNGDDLLRTIDTTDASTISSVAITLAGETVLTGTGLATNPETGELWALLKLSGQRNRELVTIDETTGIATSVGTTDVNGMAGLAFGAAPMNAAVPEPTTVALLGIGLVGLAGAEVRRRSKTQKEKESG